MNSGFTRRCALGVGALAVVGMGFTVGCSSKQAPAPTQQTDSQVESKRSKGDNEPKKSYAPNVKAPAAKTVDPAQDIAPGQPGRDGN